MPVPPNFNKVKNLTETIGEIYNKFVREEFRDVKDEDFEDFNKPRSMLRYISLVQNGDSLTAIVLRFMVFYLVLRKARDLQPPIYSVPIDDFEYLRKYRPQISLYFAQDWSTVEAGENLVRGWIKFRLMTETTQSITKVKLTEIAREIKSEFGLAGNGYLWKKGRDMASYKDIENGYDFKLLVRDKSDAKEIITKALKIQDKTPQWEKLNYRVNDSPSEAYPMVRGKQTILGKQYDKIRYRPIETVRFRYAIAHIHGYPKPIHLYDAAGILMGTLVD